MKPIIISQLVLISLKINRNTIILIPPTILTFQTTYLLMLLSFQYSLATTFPRVKKKKARRAPKEIMIEENHSNTIHKKPTRSLIAREMVSLTFHSFTTQASLQHIITLPSHLIQWLTEDKIRELKLLKLQATSF